MLILQAVHGTVVSIHTHTGSFQGTQVVYEHLMSEYHIMFNVIALVYSLV